MVYSALAVALMAGEPCLVPIYAQDKAVQAMTLTALYNLADQQSQKVRVSEVALQAASEGVAAAKSALLPSVDLSLQGSYTGNAFMLSRGFSTDGTTDYIVPGMGAIPVANGKQDTPHWGNSFTAQVSQVVYAGGAIRSGIRMAELGEKMAELDVEKNRQEVRFLLTGYYLDLYKLGNQIEVVRQNIALTQKEIDQMKARREQGTVLQNDITRYEFQLQSLELTLTKLTDASTIINHQLVTTLHLPEQTVIVPDKNELNTEIDALSAIAVQDTWQQTATDNNLGIRQATVATNLAEQKVKQAKATAFIARTEAEANTRNLYNKVSEAIANLRRQSESLHYYTSSALKEADELMKVAALQLRHSETDITEFIQAVNVARDIRRGYIETVYQYNIAALEYELFK